MFRLLICTAICTVVSAEADYYWREYNGKIPFDAVIAGQRLNGDNVYIGQGYVNQKGLMVVHINPDSKVIYAPIVGGRKVDQYGTKILCGEQNNFFWIRTNATRMHLDILDKNVVIGGHETGYGRLYVGRITYEDGVQVGKINAFQAGNTKIYFVVKDINQNIQEKSLDSYEILVYENKQLFLNNE